MLPMFDLILNIAVFLQLRTTTNFRCEKIDNNNGLCTGLSVVKKCATFVILYPDLRHLNGQKLA
jgi:hypothetical protein